ncbi:SDR family oxidoreductase [Haloechinothrix sp. YIM 98757]|uniref:SDR family oxidoreductase n=1 Tax=Haloechinothrix aidingensis TaxID=2752311 RepID=A0A838AAY4_9PSEU|nr:SDR family oxidoreductase [Haloechinothrix aidingensis]MBA0126394.1 SDR family oxidoreductase [Haloechinothrix aidingensis]
MDLGLGNRTFVVTGASSGVGLATASALLAEGAHVAACARDADRLDAALAGVPRADGALLYTAACDVLDSDAVATFIEGATHALGGVDGVVNNAGRSLLARLADTSDEQWRDELDLKVFSVLHTVRAALPWLRRSDSPAVVNINAILAKQPETELAATSAARAALLNLSSTLATEYAPDGIRVNSVCLGLIDTGQWRLRYEQSGSPLSWQEWSAELARDRGIPLGRLGTAEEVAHPVLMLLSPRASYITGTSVDVGGGIARYV